MTTYSRLSALDRSFLDIENRNTHMHVGATCVFDVGPLRGPDGGIDIERVRSYVESRLHLIPRYRQHIARIPFEGHPVWVDDEQFDIRYHVRHLSIPKPGCDRELKRLAGWINSQQLDRGKPLWEMWVIEGLEHDRFALIAKTHHCMIDGLAGADLLGVLLRPGVDTAVEEPHRWRPRPAPARTQLIRDAALRRLTLPLRAARALATNPTELWNNASDLASALYETTAASLQSASETPLNRPIGSHRRFDWLTFDLDRVKAVKNRLGGTINDVVLAVVTGGIRHYLDRRGVALHPGSGFVFRAFCPVGIQTSQRGSTGGNFVSAMMAELPVTEPDPVQQLLRVREFTHEHKGGAPVRGTEVLEALADETFPTLLSLFASAVESSRAYNLVVTNVPGPQFPLYLLGSPMTVSYPLVPLFGHQGVGIALLSYDGKLCWGFSADRDIVPDLHDLVEGMRAAFAALCEQAGLQPAKEHVESSATVAARHGEARPAEATAATPQIGADLVAAAAMPMAAVATPVAGKRRPAVKVRAPSRRDESAA